MPPSPQNVTSASDNRVHNEHRTNYISGGENRNHECEYQLHQKEYARISPSYSNMHHAIQMHDQGIRLTECESEYNPDHSPIIRPSHNWKEQE